MPEHLFPLFPSQSRRDRPRTAAAAAQLPSPAARVVCKSQPAAVATFEGVLFPHFQTILQQDVQEFVPYVFQVTTGPVWRTGTWEG